MPKPPPLTPAQLRQIKAGNYCVIVTKMIYGIEPEHYAEADPGLLRDLRALLHHMLEDAEAIDRARRRAALKVVSD
jgi:hypothetical protein